MDFYLTMYESYVFETLEYFIINVFKSKDALNEWNMNMNILCYELFKIPKIAIIL
jgi:hypothetical protein